MACCFSLCNGVGGFKEDDCYLCWEGHSSLSCSQLKYEDLVISTEPMRVMSFKSLFSRCFFGGLYSFNAENTMCSLLLNLCDWYFNWPMVILEAECQHAFLVVFQNQQNGWHDLLYPHPWQLGRLWLHLSHHPSQKKSSFPSHWIWRICQKSREGWRLIILAFPKSLVHIEQLASGGNFKCGRGRGG